MYSKAHEQAARLNHFYITTTTTTHINYIHTNNPPLVPRTKQLTLPATRRQTETSKYSIVNMHSLENTKVTKMSFKVSGKDKVNAVQQ